MDFLGLAVLIFSIILFFTISYGYYYHTHWSRNNVKSVGLVESLFAYTKILPYNDYDWAQKHGRLFGFYEIFRKGIIINDPKIIKDILITDFHLFRNRREMYLSKYLERFYVSDYDNWLRIRRISISAFTPSKVRAMFEFMVDKRHEFNNKISSDINKGASFDIKEHIEPYVMDCACYFLFGIDFDIINNPNNPLIESIGKAFKIDIGLSAILGFVAPKLAKFFGFSIFDETGIEYISKLVETILQNKKQNNEYKKADVIELLLEVHLNRKEQQKSIDKENKIKLNENKFVEFEEILSNVVAFFIGGNDSIAATLTHFCYFIALNTDVQDTLYEELSTIEVLNESSNSDVKYLNAVIQETLRMCPPGNRIDRIAEAPYKIRNTDIIIPAGTIVTFSHYCVYHDPEYFESPFEFKPERFYEENCTKLKKLELSPFSAGPKMCMGSNFAMQQMRIFIFNFVKKFELSIEPNYKMDYPTGNLLLSPKHLVISAKYRT